MRRMSRASAIVLIVLVVGAAYWYSRRGVVLSAADNGRDVSIALGQQFQVRLKANHTTPYRWVLTTSGTEVEQQGTPDYTEEASLSGRVGIGGVETWRFKGAHAGTERLSFEYRHVGEGTPSGDAVQFQITVR